MGSLAEQKKAILPYLQRADEIAKLDPKVAYYCRLYAIQQGIALENRAPEVNGVLEALMERLEKDKPMVQVSPEDGQYCEQFAMVVFNRADKADRAGKADKNTVKAFYVASVFIDILRQFSPDGELPIDMAERQQYAAWKAADIRKALREGRTPTAGPPIKDDELDLPGVPGAAASGSLPDVPTPGTGSGDAGLPSVPSGPVNAVAPMPPGQAAPPPGLSAGQARFRRGSKVFYNSGPGMPPVKGTVVVVTAEPSGTFAYKVGLSQEIVLAPEASLAHDFAVGDHALYEPRSGPPVDVTVEQLDDSQWPVAYKLTLADGSTQLSTDQRLKPKEIEASRHDSLGKPPRSPSTSPPKRMQSSSPPSEPTPFFPPPLDSATAPSTASPPPSCTVPSVPLRLGKVDSAYQGPSEDSRDSGAAAAGSPPHTGPNFDTKYAGPSLPPAPPSMPAPAPSSSTSDQPQSPPSLPPPSFQRHDFMAPPSGPALPQAAPLTQGAQGAFSLPQPPASPAVNSQGSVIVTPTPGFVPSMLAISEAQKLSKYAVSSLGFEDVPTAVEYLTKALTLLTQPQSK